jgi:hypothetical protein
MPDTDLLMVDGLVTQARLADPEIVLGAAGDITDYPGKVRLIAVGFGEATTAVNNIAVRPRPDEELFPGPSTERDPPWPT